MGVCLSCCIKAEEYDPNAEIKYENEIDTVSPLTGGPYLRLKKSDGSQYVITALIVVKAEVQGTPTLAYESTGAPGEKTVTATKLSTYTGPKGKYNIFLFTITVGVTEEEQKMTYRLPKVGETTLSDFKWTVVVPGRTQPWRWAFYSCSGLSENWGEDKGFEDQYPEGILPLWRDLKAKHDVKPFHLMVGGGDQLYNDGVFTEARGIIKWLKGKDDKLLRSKDPWTPEMATDVEEYYFTHYIEHFGQDTLRHCYASIPSVMNWDDHDVFDGWGSYPEYLQKCEIFVSMYNVARKYYLIFQQHADPDNIDTEDLWGPGLNTIRQLGPRVALVNPDTRTDRSITQVIAPQGYEEMFRRMEELPTTVKHIVMCLPVPIVYPHLGGAEEALALLQSYDPSAQFSQLMAKTGLWASLINGFEEPELLDDLRDHWDAVGHAKEREDFLERLQEFQAKRKVRISFISGDVHLACIGELRSVTPPAAGPVADDKYMIQIVSSGIGNGPPPGGLAKQLAKAGKGAAWKDGVTYESMLDKFGDVPGAPSASMLPLRNWCMVEESLDEAAGGSALSFQIRIEDQDTKNPQAPVHAVDQVVPALVSEATAAA